MNDGNTSIEFVSETGPMDFSVMMQEGVKALTKILSTHIQDNPHLLKDNSMKVIFKENNGNIKPILTSKGAEQTRSEKLKYKSDGSEIHYKDENSDDRKQEAAHYEDYEVIEFDNEGNYHVCERSSEESNSHIINTKEEFQSQVDISISPYNSDETDRIIELDTKDIQRSAEPISSFEHEIIFEHDNGESTKFLPPLISDSNDNDRPQDHLHPSPSEKNDTDVASNASCSSCLCHSNDGNSYRRFFRYDYPKQRHYSVPNFKALMHYNMAGQTLCPICEYYVVFGTPPKQMMRWYSSKRQNTYNETFPSYHCREHYPSYAEKSNDILEDRGLTPEDNIIPDNDQEAEYLSSGTKRSKRKKKKSKKKGKR